MKQKLENYAVGYIESIAAKRKRNVEWAKSSVKESAVLTADQALESKVVEIIARDTGDLLRQLDGREVQGKKLHTAGAGIVEIRMSLSEMLFQKLWRPEVMFILMLMAIYGIIGELSHPGVILPGVVGAIALVLALYMSAILPVNSAGLALVALALLLFAIDVFAPTHGVLTFGGIAAFFIGSLMLFDRNEPAFSLSLGYIIPATLVTAAFFLFVVGAGLRAQRLPVRTGPESMVGRSAVALTPIDAQGGRVLLDGEDWQAVCDLPVEKGGMVEIIGFHGLTVQVARSASASTNPIT
jgi:membrane-bound serine protease (ClpP class)